MPAFDDDDSRSFDELPRGTGGRGGGGRGGGKGKGGKGRGGNGNEHDSWDVDEDPDARDLVPDEMDTVRCGGCRKLIFEDSVRCPYCGHMQVEEENSKKPMWFVLTAVVCVVLIGGIYLLYLLGLFNWRLP